MTKTIHTATLPDGSVAKRTSKSRTYSHVVVGQVSYEAALRSAKVRDPHVSHFRYLSKCASVQPGETYPEPGFSFPVDAKAHAEGVAMLEATPTRDGYVDAKVAAAVAAVEARRAAGDFDKWEALTWASRFSLANAQASGARWPRHKNLRVLSTDRAA